MKKTILFNKLENKNSHSWNGSGLAALTHNTQHEPAKHGPDYGHLLFRFLFVQHRLP
jgi:hypothetical protein